MPSGSIERALRRHDPGARVVRVDDLGSGTSARSRVTVFSPAGALPSTVFVKQPARSPIARAVGGAARLARTEAAFYRHERDAVPVSVPVCYHAADRGTPGAFLLVIEDLRARGARFGDLGDAFDAADAGKVLTDLASLHGRFWSGRGVDAGLHGLLGPFEAGAGARLAPALVRRGLRRAGAAVPDACRAPALAYAAKRTAITRRLDAVPRTLLHHDCHPGNLAVTPDGRRWFTDWQLTRTGPWARDVAYHLATALAVEDRRAKEAALLADYLDALRDAGGEPPPVDVAVTEYRRHLPYAFEAMVVTFALGAMQREDRVREVVKRTAAAALDHQAWSYV